MNAQKMIAIALILAGTLGLVYGGFMRQKSSFSSRGRIPAPAEPASSLVCINPLRFSDLINRACVC